MRQTEFIDRARACERRLYRVARTMLSREADCEDAVQEALLRAWERLDTLREEAYFETWLIRILINQCKSLRRRRPTAEAELTEDIPMSPEGEPALLDALMKLPGKLRIALELHYIEGYSVKESSRIMNIPEGTVKWRLSRGRAALKAEMEREEART